MSISLFLTKTNLASGNSSTDKRQNSICSDCVDDYGDGNTDECTECEDN